MCMHMQKRSHIYMYLEDPVFHVRAQLVMDTLTQQTLEKRGEVQLVFLRVENSNHNYDPS